LIETPEIGRPGRIEGTRELVIPRTPYIAAYRIEREMAGGDGARGRHRKRFGDIKRRDSVTELT